MDIDWRRVAEPQEDGYDIRVTLQCVQEGAYSNKRPKSVGPGSKQIWPEGRACFINANEEQLPSHEYRGMGLDNQLVKNGIALLDHWPAMKSFCAHTMIGLGVLTTGIEQTGHGCTCGNYGDDWGWIYVTGDNAWGLAEGIVHEMNHWKLRAFGVWFEEWGDTLLANGKLELYDSPVRKDIARPMGAVLHAQYSYIAVAEMCNRMLWAEPHPNSSDIDWAALQIRRITEGQGTIRLHAKGTKAGEQFLIGMDDWTSRVINEGTALVERLGGRV